MRYFPFLGFVKSGEDRELADLLGLEEDNWSILIFEWLDFSFAFYASRPRDDDET